MISGDRERLYQQAIEIIGKDIQPVDQWEITVLLEMCGINDQIARDEYKSQDVFDLAAEIYQYILNRKVSTPLPEVDVGKMTLLRIIKFLFSPMKIRDFLRSVTLRSYYFISGYR